MSRIKVLDAGGDALPMFQYQGQNYPNYVQTDSIVNIHKIPIREDDIIICGFPKSGTHWVWEASRMLLAGHLLNDAVEKGVGMLEYAPHDDIQAMSSPRLLNTHFMLSRLPPDIVTKRCKIVYLLRNPKDVAVSYYNFMLKLPYYNYKGKWENFMKYHVLGKFSYGSWFDFVFDWEEEKRKHPELPILTLHYEDMKENNLRELRKLDKFLGTDRGEDFLCELYEHTSFTGMNHRKAQISSEQGGVCWTVPERCRW
ncbi:sulfotransferase 1B1-like [Haliotis rubra]|uniref:sulfotransferase 1B1-like n=1 Tax=Haliotis rubra TaxID=36100 RepID=UPI001EE54106|nr:sulfotransferase 1B1-like [Haliotis rubra]XP_046564630.1 sulfotransferase 1B1-like [Haliotis rubra]XP_046564631.1 sulfotransferase 1B1-like [Haliotis rubra]XP_046564632.1 sulfotransferase 1B1-like [Haliotis rubra]